MNLPAQSSNDAQRSNQEALHNLSVEHSDAQNASQNSSASSSANAAPKIPQNTARSAQTPDPTTSQIHTTAAIEILASWSKESREFGWVQSKGEIFCAFGSFNLLLIVILVGSFMTGRQKFVFILPCLVTIVGSILLLGALVLDFQRSKPACFYTSPVLFLLAFLSWFIPDISCISGAVDVWCESQQARFSETMGLVVSISLPWLLTAAPIMTWQASCFLSLVIPSMFLYTLIAQNMGSKSSLQIVAVISLVILLSATNVSLQYLKTRKLARILSMIDTWSNAFVESKLHEEQALQAREKDTADKISKMRQFISYIFHEIRVPFNAVVLGIGHLLSYNLSEDQQEILKMMDSSSSSMIHILNDVLDMGKIESGKLHLEKQPFNIGEMVNSLIWAFRDTFDSKGIEFSLGIDPDTKELLSKNDLLGDKHRLCQVLSNYLSNATKFTPRGGKVSLRVVCNGISKTDFPLGEAEISQVSEGEGLNHEDSGRISSCTLDGAGKETYIVASITVSVEDTGIGISKEDQATLFAPYSQISAGLSQGGGGTGLGLSFAKRIVELAGGKIGVFSEVGKGSVFFFTIPFQLVEYSSKIREGEVTHFHCSTKNNTQGPTLNQLQDHSGHNPRVLIVEDNFLNRKVLRKLLDSLNVESDDAENGKQAVELVRKGVPYDMILMDKEMPIMDGHEATRELRSMGVKCPIVGLTGNALDSDRNQFLAAGVDNFFTKPISRHQLVRLLELYGLIVQNKDKDTSSYVSLPSILNS